MLHAGLDLSRRRLDVCLLSERGEHLDQLVAPPDVDALRRLARRIDDVHGEPVCAVIESITGARLVHDTPEAEGWSVEIAGAQRQDRLARPRHPLAPRPGAGDLAARSPGPRGARARPLSHAPGPPQVIAPVRTIRTMGSGSSAGLPSAARRTRLPSIRSRSRRAPSATTSSWRSRRWATSPPGSASSSPARRCMSMAPTASSRSIRTRARASA